MTNLTPDALAFAVLWYVVFLFSTVCHEAAHAIAAKWGGDLTAYLGGQVTLDPWPHIRREPFGLVAIPWISFALGGAMMGWASAPYNPLWQHRYPKRAAWMALAGPMANFALAILAAVMLDALAWSGLLPVGRAATAYTGSLNPLHDGIFALLVMFFRLNVLLGTFNLLPIPPLDGYSVLGLFVSTDVSHKLDEFRGQMASFSLIGVFLGWQIFENVLYSPIMGTATKLLLHFPE